MPSSAENKPVIASMDETGADINVDAVEISKDVKEHKFVNFIPGSTKEEMAKRRTQAAALKLKFEEDDDLFALVEALPKAERDVFWTIETCERYLVARDMKEEKATEMLSASLKWRAKHKPFQINEEEVKACLDAGSVFVAGRCKAGRPILYISVGAINNFPAVKRLQLIAFLMEESLRRGHQQLTWIFNFSRLGENKGTDPEAKKSRKMMMDMCQNHYPERLGALHLINTPWYINMLATIVWPFIDKATKAKINVKCTDEELLKYVDKKELLDTFGGERKRGSKAFDDAYIQ